VLAVAIAAAACTPVAPPSPSLSFAGLPVSGTVGDARRAGFTGCVDLDARHIRCRRHAVMFEAAGPYEAAVDLAGSSGEGGFDHLTLWHDTDNDAVFRAAAALEAAGWARCLTGNGRAGDQAIYTRAGIPVRVSVDISYWGRRRLRLIPSTAGDAACAGHSVGRNSGTDR
jgi:hypothetical protein